MWPYLSPTRVQVSNSHILTQNLHCNYYYPKPKVPNYWVLGPFGFVTQSKSVQTGCEGWDVSNHKEDNPRPSFYLLYTFIPIIRDHIALFKGTRGVLEQSSLAVILLELGSGECSW